MDFEGVENYLPESIKGMVAVIGLLDTEKLVKAFGGVSFQFSGSAKCFERLVDVLGEESAVKLQSYIGVGEVYIPRCETALRILRNQQIYAEFCYLTENKKMSGRMAVLALCPKYRVSDRTAWEAIRYYQQNRKRQQITLI